MEHQISFNEVEESIQSELKRTLDCKLKLRKLFEEIPKEYARKLHDNYLGEGPTRAILSGHFHETLNEEDRRDLLQILEKKFMVESEN